MKKTLILILLALSTAFSASAQEAAQNKAFKNGETVQYVLKFNWGPIWINVGTAEWRVVDATYEGQQVHKVSLRTTTNKRADKYFTLRDTMTTYVTPKLIPLFFDKRGSEGKRYCHDYVKYSYNKGKCSINTYRRVNERTPKTHAYASTTCAYDMVSMMLRARSFDPKGWAVGHRETFLLADGNGCNRQSIVYRGKKTISIEDSSAKYRCLVFSFMERENDKETEIVKFYISDDDNHLPVRLDLNLTFGSAKAFMTKVTNARNAETARIKK